MLTVLLGGARSGKTTLAVDAARRGGGSVTYLATAPMIEGDHAFTSRIDHHRSERPEHWITIEEELDISAALANAESDIVIIDCLTTWVANQLHHGVCHDAIRGAAAATADMAARSSTEVIAVTNEVGMGIHPATDLGRRYRDLLGWVNQEWVGAADRALLLVAGRAIPLNDPWDLLASP